MTILQTKMNKFTEEEKVLTTKNWLGRKRIATDTNIYKLSERGM